jgi:hypothetical protein
MDKRANSKNNLWFSYSSSRRTVIAIVLIVMLGIGTFGFGATASVKAATWQNETAQDVVAAYYYNINAKDYYSAYLLWGRNFQSTHSYSAFAGGFADTVSDDINIHSTSQQANGTTRVDVTLYATEAVAAGTRISTYQGWYIVGPEDGVLKLLSANIWRV